METAMLTGMHRIMMQKKMETILVRVWGSDHGALNPKPKILNPWVVPRCQALKRRSQDPKYNCACCWPVYICCFIF